MLVSIDLSLRSSGVCVIDASGELVDFTLVAPSKSIYNDEELLQYISWSVGAFVQPYDQHTKAIVIEGLSYNSFSADKDKIAGNLWHLRCSLKEKYPDVPIGIISVAQWRASVLSKPEQKEAKQYKDGLKKACVAKLPEHIRGDFLTMVQDGKYKKDSIYDLSDAYWLGQYRLSLGL